MSVYTEVGRDDLNAFLADYSLGELVSFRGISEGIENTNYFVTTSQGEYVLTLFEQHDFDELGYFLHVMSFFFEHGIPSAHPAADSNGDYLKMLCGRPAALVIRLAGRGVDTVATIEQCRAIGDILGRMHLAGQEFPFRQQNPRGAAWREQTASQLEAYLSDDENALLSDEIKSQRHFDTLDLPWGVTHTDLFRDNALFDGDELKGIIDFYYACDEYLTYDLAVAINDWCVDEHGLVDPERYRELMQAYLRHREFTDEEIRHWNLMLRAAALRFWLSRLQDKLFPREGEMTQIKTPEVFSRILLQHREQTFSVEALFA